MASPLAHLGCGIKMPSNVCLLNDLFYRAIWGGALLFSCKLQPLPFGSHSRLRYIEYLFDQEVHSSDVAVNKLLAMPFLLGHDRLQPALCLNPIRERRLFAPTHHCTLRSCQCKAPFPQSSGWSGQSPLCPVRALTVYLHT